MAAVHDSGMGNCGTRRSQAESGATGAHEHHYHQYHCTVPLYYCCDNYY